MSRAQVSQRRITAVAKGLQAAGLGVKRVDVDPGTGRITVIIGNGQAEPASAAAEEQNEIDVLMQKWKNR